MSFLDDIDGVVLDMDGVLYRGDEVIEGSPEAVAALRERGIGVIFATNNASKTPSQYVESLASMGIDASESEVVTSATATAGMLESRGLSGSTAIVVGRDGIRVALQEVGITVIADPDIDSADMVVVGWDPTFDYASLRRAATAVRNGALFIATNTDATFPHSTGLWPGAGALVSAIETASGHSAEVVGKPHRPMLEEALEKLGGDGRIAMVGDRPDTDLAGAHAMGWATVLVLSGVARDADGVEPPPDLVLDSLTDLPSQ